MCWVGYRESERERKAAAFSLFCWSVSLRCFFFHIDCVYISFEQHTFISDDDDDDDKESEKKEEKGKEVEHDNGHMGPYTLNTMEINNGIL